MGYYTDYKLSYKGNIDDHILVEALDEVTGYSWDNHFSQSGVKWYAALKNMKEISKRFPSTLFTLSGEGEESGDLWRAYYLNGKEQYEKAQVSFEPFDEAKLK